MKRMMTTRIAVLMIAAMAASGCGILKKGTPKTPVLGQRVAVLTTENDVAVDPATAALPMVLPAPVANSEWGQAGGNAAKSMGHLALGSALARAFSISIGYGSTLTARLGSAPVVGGGRIYTIDTNATVAVPTPDWRPGLGERQSATRGNSARAMEGGVAYENGSADATTASFSRRDRRAQRGTLAMRPGGRSRAPTSPRHALRDQPETSSIAEGRRRKTNGRAPPRRDRRVSAPPRPVVRHSGCRLLVGE